MTALDTAIKATMDKYSITLFPCIENKDGLLLVPEIETQYNCVVDTYGKAIKNDNGTISITSTFYLFSAIDRNELDVLGDTNPKQQLLLTLADKIFNDMRSRGYVSKTTGSDPASRLTGGYEVGRVFTITFNVDPSCLS